MCILSCVYLMQKHLQFLEGTYIRSTITIVPCAVCTLWQSTLGNTVKQVIIRQSSLKKIQSEKNHHQTAGIFTVTLEGVADDEGVLNILNFYLSFSNVSINLVNLRILGLDHPRPGNSGETKKPKFQVHLLLGRWGKRGLKWNLCIPVGFQKHTFPQSGIPLSAMG